jgi:hypothetical protein
MTTLRGAIAIAIGLSTTTIALPLVATAAEIGDTRGTIAAPSISPAPGGYEWPQTISFTEATKDTEIYYTTDGSTPTNASIRYRKPFTLGGTATVQAVAVERKTGKTSAVTSGTYLFDSGAVPVSAVFSNGQFWNVGANGGFDPFGGSLNNPAPAIDATTPFIDGSASLKVNVTGVSGNYSGGAWLSNVQRNVSGANALTFWAKASKTQNTLKIQLGNDAGCCGFPNWQVESIGIPLTTTWQQYVIPLPDPAKATAIEGLISFADANNNYNFWLADVEYAVVSPDDIGAPSNIIAPWSNATLAPGATSALNPVNIIWSGTAPTLPNGQTLDNVSWRWFTLSSDNQGVATVSPDGVITAVANGTAHITATLAGTQIPGEATITVGSLASPTSNAPTPTLPPSSVTALFDSSGVYPPHVDALATVWSPAVFVDPFNIPGGNGVLEYTLNNFAFAIFGDGEVSTTNTVDATALGYTKFHASVWSPNPTDLQFQLVNNASCNDSAGCFSSTGFSVGIYDAGVIAANTWVDFDLPISSFTGGGGLTATDALQQLGLISGAGNGLIVFVDNLYFH